MEDNSFMPNAIQEDTLDDIAELFKILGDSTRVKILYSLAKGELNVGKICDNVGLNASAVSHQLRVLRQAHLVKSRKKGKEVYYSIDDDHVETIFKCALEHINEK